MAGEAVRSVTRYGDDYGVETVLIPVFGTGSALDVKTALLSFDRDVVLDAAWITVPGTGALNVALGTTATARLFKVPATDRVVSGIAGNSVALSSSLSVNADNTIAKKPFTIDETNNIVRTGEVIALSYGTSASVAASGLAEVLSLSLRFRTKNNFAAVGADELKKTA